MHIAAVGMVWSISWCISEKGLGWVELTEEEKGSRRTMNIGEEVSALVGGA